MMVPVVFLVLPVTILFAVFPGFSFLAVLGLKSIGSKGRNTMSTIHGSAAATQASITGRSHRRGCAARGPQRAG